MEGSANAVGMKKKRAISLETGNKNSQDTLPRMGGGVHAKIMKSSLVRAISLRKFDNNWHSPNHNSLA